MIFEPSVRVRLLLFLKGQVWLANFGNNLSVQRFYKCVSQEAGSSRREIVYSQSQVLRFFGNNLSVQRFLIINYCEVEFGNNLSVQRFFFKFCSFGGFKGKYFSGAKIKVYNFTSLFKIVRNSGSVFSVLLFFFKVLGQAVYKKKFLC